MCSLVLQYPAVFSCNTLLLAAWLYSWPAMAITLNPYSISAPDSEVLLYSSVNAMDDSLPPILLPAKARPRKIQSTKQYARRLMGDKQRAKMHLALKDAPKMAMVSCIFFALLCLCRKLVHRSARQRLRAVNSAN
ncbi:hypothetical protein FX988_01769 [Paraglaciecola mesophila]|uniref:Uncharacterized protein n=1 Tax=Paraglaciecola mesophila TaxID=197222 RepID=A0A857JHP9_9ALTE|nr:hypothetical protein [Paraglaciecola mesophila]QHJ11535.1 hypothetical protein FX988_01769 [Paraglaciecola mesophila]